MKGLIASGLFVTGLLCAPLSFGASGPDKPPKPPKPPKAPAFKISADQKQNYEDYTKAWVGTLKAIKSGETTTSQDSKRLEHVYANSASAQQYFMKIAPDADAISDRAQDLYSDMMKTQSYGIPNGGGMTMHPSCLFEHPVYVKDSNPRKLDFYAVHEGCFDEVAFAKQISNPDDAAAPGLNDSITALGGFIIDPSIAHKPLDPLQGLAACPAGFTPPKPPAAVFSAPCAEKMSANVVYLKQLQGGLLTRIDATCKSAATCPHSCPEGSTLTPNPKGGLEQYICVKDKKPKPTSKPPKKPK